MTGPYSDIIRKHCRPLDPIPTGELPVLRELQSVRAVVLDIYGTLLVSASGDIAASQAVAKGAALADALAAVGVGVADNGDGGLECLLSQIEADHQSARQAGIEHPEVDIVDIWRQTLMKLHQQGYVARLSRDAVDGREAPRCEGVVRHKGLDPSTTLSPADEDSETCAADDLGEVDLGRLAVEYEVRVNPVWPMPHARECLEQLSRTGCTLGLLSNAQFFTREILAALLAGPLAGYGLDGQLQYYSYQYGRAKPGLYLYELAANELARRGIEVGQTVYVGNDMLNDIMPASRIGFQTALFAGDARSLRRRQEDERVADVKPDIIITDLLDLPKCLR